MHSLTIAQNILWAVLKEAAKHEGKQVRCINVKVGGHHAEEADSIQFCLEAMIRGTAIEGARVDMQPMPQNAGDANPLQVTLEMN